MRDILVRAVVDLAATPSPSPGPDPDQVSPGVLGFVVTFLVAVAAVLLVLDMVRRIRRVRYRAEIAEKLDAEQAEAQATGSSDAGEGDDDTTRSP